jgi:hypothetical protein
MTTRTVQLRSHGQLVCGESGEVLSPPSGWALLPPGDAALTRRVKAVGPHWVVEDRSRRRVRSRGVWAPAERILRQRAALERERATPAYAQRLQASRARRAEQQLDYVEDFRGAVLEFLAFAPAYAELAQALARAVTEHATPVGAGTVARTKRIPLEERARAAVIAWLRHQTTAYDSMDIERVKGRRREVRRRLAQRSRRLLAGFRRGDPVEVESCPLHRALRADLAPEGAAAGPPPPALPRRRLLGGTGPAAPAKPTRRSWDRPLSRRSR